MNIITQILITIPVAVITYVVGRFSDSNKQIFDTKIKLYSEIVYEINSFIFILYGDKTQFDKIMYKNNLIKLFAPARLIGSSNVVNEIREYFSLINEYFDSKSEKSKEIILDKITKSGMELEQCMRNDLFRSRHLSKWNISQHLKKKIDH